MPTVIVVDESEGMGCGVGNEEVDGGGRCKLELAAEGLCTVVDYLASRQRLEYVCLLTFSGEQCLPLTPFTRDWQLLKERLRGLRPVNDTGYLLSVPTAVEKLVLSEWDSSTECNLIIVTQEKVVVPPGCHLGFPFPVNLLIISVTNGPPPDSLKFLPQRTPHKCKVYVPESPLVLRSFHLMFYKMCEEHFSPWIGSLTCGNLNAKIVLSPNPRPYDKVTDFDRIRYTVDRVVEICGFLEMGVLGSPGAVSRHLVLPYSSCMAGLPPPVDGVKAEHHLAPDSSTGCGEEDEAQAPSLCVLLHGALRVENMAALCYLGNHWYGVLYSCADSKKKSNLMLSLLEPGPEPVPWLGNLDDMMIPSGADEMELCQELPVKPAARRVFLPNPSSWIRQPGLQADIQKVLRHARKLPDKTQQFFKELNRVRKAALSIGFVQLLEGLAAILERECTMLPGTAHPACAIQLCHASSVLKEPVSLDIRYNMMPLKMSF